MNSDLKLLDGSVHIDFLRKLIIQNIHKYLHYMTCRQPGFRMLLQYKCIIFVRKKAQLNLKI